MQMEKRRWLVVVGAMLVQLCLGAIYAWSAFTKHLTLPPYDFNRTQTQAIFSLGLLSFAVVMALIAGKWQAKVGPRRVALVGGLVLGAGYVMAGLSGASFYGMLIGIGLLGGAGIGLGYVCPIAALVKWFPDKKGLITGLAVAGFGFGALIWIKLTSGFEFGPLNLTPGWAGLFGDGLSVNQIFILYGILFAAIVALGSTMLVNPPDGFRPEGWTPPTDSRAALTGGIDFTVSEMVRTSQFWGLFFIFAVGATAGLMVIGVIKLFGMEALAARGVDDLRAGVITGTAMGLFYALMNGLGRVAWGFISDKIGRRASIAAMSLLQGVTMIAFYYTGGTETGLYIGSAIVGFNFGGNFALFPAATADFFGNRSVGTNYPWIFMSYGLGGLVGPLLGGAMGDARVWMWAFIPAGVACLAAGVVALRLRSPHHKAVMAKGGAALSAQPS
ncbi:MAG: OFA family MFS transporter [Proteobacteria bacterium]|nr:OFA family MFS transporter [Pseudomonadota bacterium]